MTREKEILKEAYICASANTQIIGDWGEHYLGFIHGAEWADAHPHWISVEDELPPRGRTDPNVSVPVITCKIVNRELHEIGFQQYIFGNGKWKYCDATHWMSLPQPPTVAKNATVKEKGGDQ